MVKMTNTKDLKKGDIIVNKKTGKRFVVIGRDKIDKNLILIDDLK